MDVIKKIFAQVLILAILLQSGSCPCNLQTGFRHDIKQISPLRSPVWLCQQFLQDRGDPENAAGSKLGNEEEAKEVQTLLAAI